MAKKKIRLTPDQKHWHENLTKYGRNYVIGNQNLKEVVLDGPFAVLTGSGDDDFDCVICTDSHDAAKIVAKWCLTGQHRVLDLRGLEPKVVYEVWERREP